MISLECKGDTVYLRKILVMFFMSFLVLVMCNNAYAAGGDNNTDPVGLIEKACKVYNAINPILSFVILIVVIMTALAALFGKLSMAVVVTVMISAIIIKQAPVIVNLVSGDKGVICGIAESKTTS